jgi:hypothetical protein
MLAESFYDFRRGGFARLFSPVQIDTAQFAIPVCAASSITVVEETRCVRFACLWNGIVSRGCS